MRMELGLTQQQTLKQIQTLSPQMYMSMEILCLNALDLEQRLATELENNETLERVETPAEGAEGAAETESESKESERDTFEERFEQWDRYAREEYGEPPGARRAASYRGEKDEKQEALSNTEGRPISLQEQLEQQVHLLSDEEVRAICIPVQRKLAEGNGVTSVELQRIIAEAFGHGAESRDGPRREASRREASRGEASRGDDSGDGLPEVTIRRIRDVCQDIIYNIDERGYLMYSLEEIQVSLEDEAPLAVLQMALAIIQSLEPAGVGGRNLPECLLLQLARDPQDYPLEEQIIRNHLDDLGHNRLPKIARGLGVTVEDVKEAAENIASLDPLPGSSYSTDAPRYVKPDVLVDEVDGRYEVRVESDYLPRLHVSPHYRSLYKESRKNPEVKKYLKKKIDNAEWLLAAIRQRQSTLQKIAQEIVEIQQGFFDHGISQLKPLKMADVAERLGVHVSTISRAISGKYMQSPRGIHELKSFFTGGATKDDGNVEARGSVIQRIKELVANEDKKNPFSDISIVRKLGESGIRISRRTVTKYREAEGIPSSRERRAY